MKKNNSSFCVKMSFFLLFLWLSSSVGYSKNPSYQIDSIYKQSGMKRIANQIHRNGWMNFNDTLKFDKETFFKKYRAEFGLKENDKVEFLKKESDQYGFEHIRFQQKYKGYKVEFSDYIVHVKDGYAKKSSGRFALDLNVNTQNLISEKQAIKCALNHVNAAEYAWNVHQGKNLVDYPKGELVILQKNEGIGILADCIAYKFEIYAIQPLYRSNVYVDAHSGKIVFENSLIKDVSATGSAETLYSDTRSLTTDNYSGTYRLRDMTRGDGIYTKNLRYGILYGDAVDYTDADNYWSPADPGFDAHWGAQKTYDYYFNTFGRNSYDNEGEAIYCYVHYLMGYNNAFWNGSVLTFGDGDGTLFNPFVCLDVVAHEFTHGLTDRTANLVYSHESGALNESFSDIFGTCVDFYARPTEANWLHGEEMSLTDSTGRDLSNPNNRNQPDTYQGTYWASGSSDNGGVHTNSGVPNYWFYLLSNGGSGTNDLNYQFNVTGIGIQASAMIAYRMLTMYLTPSSNFADARQAAIEAASDLFGLCSDTTMQVLNAWNAVGVYGPTNIQDTLYVNGTLPDGDIYIASDVLYAGAGGATAIASGSTVVFRAGECIDLKPGFSAVNGCTFKASAYTNNGVVLRSATFTNDEELPVLKPEDGVSDLQLYPNPTDGILNLQIPQGFEKGCTVKIYSSAGLLVYQQKFAQNQFAIDLTNLPSGPYLLKAITGDQIFSDKFSKR